MRKLFQRPKNEFRVLKFHCRIYRVSHIKLDRVNKSRLMEFFFVENARFFEYYVRILALKIGDSLIWYGTISRIYCTIYAFMAFFKLPIVH